jgi:ribosomal protein S7
VTLIAAGPCTIQASQPGNANWSAATPVSQTFQVTPGAQTIAFGPLSSQHFGSSPFAVSASASSGLTVTFASATPSACTLSGTTVTLVAAGTCTIKASQSGNANWAAATPVSQSFQVTQGSQTIAFGSLSNQPYGSAPFAVSASASSGLAVTFASTTPAACTLSGTTVTLVAVGTCTIKASQPGNANWAAATPVSQSFQVTQASQTITFAALTNRAYGAAPFTVSATASSGLTVAFTSTTPAICSLSGATVTLVAAGTCTIKAAQSGNANYAAATPVNQSFQVTQASQTITFGALSNRAYGSAPFTVSATASSGLAVAFASTTTPVCAVSGATVTLVAAGTCTIQATQPGNANYAAATPVNQSFQVTQASQTITFAALPNQHFGTPPFTVSATATSGLTVSFASTTPAVCTVSGTTVTLVATGTCTIRATQTGNANYAAATPVTQSFQVTQASQTITFGALSNRAYGSAPFTVSATASSGLAVAFASTTTPVCTVSGATVTLVAVGTCTIQATQPGNANYAAATPVNQSFQVTQASQTITFAALPNQHFGTSPFTVSATASSGLPVSFASATLTVCTVSGTTVTLVSTGTCTIKATQAGNANWAAATPISQSFQVTQGTQTISFAPLSSQHLGIPPFTVSATASSGLPVSFASATTTVCTVSGSTVTLLATGTCTIKASQPGNANWAAATPVSQSFQVK